MKTKPVEKEGPTNPSVLLLIKLGAIVVHFDELTEMKWFKEAVAIDALHEGTSQFDLNAISTVFDDEVKQWIKDMGPLLPLKRSTRK